MDTKNLRFVESLNCALHQSFETDNRVHIIGEDVSDPSGGTFRVTKGLSSRFPDRVISTPISESSIVGVGIGLALRGMLPIVEIMFGDFLTLCADQIINHAAKYPWVFNDQVSVPLVVRTPMGGRRGYGPTHSQTLEAIFFNTPHIKIIAPSHFHLPGEILRHSIFSEKTLTLFIENKLLYAQRLINAETSPDLAIQVLTDTDPRYPTITVDVPGEQEPDAVVICYGGMAEVAIDAQEQLFSDEELRIRVIIPSQIIPMPMLDILRAIGSCSRVVVAEEGHRTSGWGAELSATLYEQRFKQLDSPIKRVAAKNCPIPTGKPLEQQMLPSKDDIIRAVFEMIDINL